MAGSRPSYSQVEHLVEFLEQNPGIAKGLLRTAHAKIESRRKWETLASSINALGGANKTAQGWAKYWAEKKCALKKQSALLNASAKRTGGGVDHGLPHLSPLDKRLVAIMGGLEFASGDSGLAINPFPNPNLNIDRVGAVEETGSRIIEEPEPVLDVNSPVILIEHLEAPTSSGPTQSTPPAAQLQASSEWSGASNRRRRNRPARNVDAAMDRLAEIERNRVDAELKTAEAFVNVANGLQGATAALQDIATAMNRIAAALEQINRPHQ